MKRRTAEQVAADRAAARTAVFEACPGLKVAIVKARMMTAGRPNDPKFLQDMRAKLANALDFYERVGWTEEDGFRFVDEVARLEKWGVKIENDRTVEDAIRADPRNWIKEGRYEVRGTILSVKESQFYAGYRYQYSLKMLVADDVGRKFWCSCPSSAEGEPARGRRVRFTATVKRSEKDPIFGVCQRPADVVVSPL